MPLEVTRMIASVGASIVGSGTVSTRTSCVPCQVNAFMAPCATQATVRLLAEDPVTELAARPLDEHVDDRGKHHRRDPEQPDLGLVADAGGQEEPVGGAGEEDDGDEREDRGADGAAAR